MMDEAEQLVDSPGMWGSFTQWLRDYVAPPLAEALRPMDEWLNGLPAWTGSACAVGLFVLAGLAVLFVPRRYVYLGAPNQRAWRDLRLWAILALVPYILIYLAF